MGAHDRSKIATQIIGPKSSSGDHKIQSNVFRKFSNGLTDASNSHILVPWGTKFNGIFSDVFYKSDREQILHTFQIIRYFLQRFTILKCYSSFSLKLKYFPQRVHLPYVHKHQPS